ncbi:MAG: sialidase family protein [Candidatus Latescibacterota bacterium]|jgi:hypothetical protein
MKQDEILSVAMAVATPQHPRHSESDIIRLRDGCLLLGWTEFYAGVGDDHGAARIVGRVSADGGRTWGDQYTLVENDGACNVMEVNLLRLRSGSLALFHCQKNVEVGGAEPADCRVMLRRSEDEGRTFGPAQEITGEKRYIETASGRSLMLQSDRILVECDDLGAAFCLRSDDDGATWREGRHVHPAGGGCWEPAAVELQDGRVLMFLRTTLGGQYQTVSSDGGETWSEPVLSPLRGTGAPISIERIPSTGDLLAIWNNDLDSPRARNPLTAAISRNDGRTWDHYRDLAAAPDDAFAYPSVTFADDAALLTYFNYKDGISLFLKRIPIDWLYA